MSIIIKLQGLPLEASSIDVRRYFLGLKIPDGGVHIVGGADGSVFIEFDSDEDARQAMSRNDGIIKSSNIKLLLSSRTEMQMVVEAARQQKQQYLQQQQQQPQILQQSQLLPQSNFQQSLPGPQQGFLQPQGGPMGPPMLPQQQQSTPFDGDPRMLSQNYQGILNVIYLQQQQHHQQQQQQQPPLQNPPPLQQQQPLQQPLLQQPLLQQPLLQQPLLQQPLLQQPLLQQPLLQQPLLQQPPLLQPQQMLLPPTTTAPNFIPTSRMSGMRGGDDKLFANKRCVLAASNIPYRATSKDIIDFLAEFNINEDCIRRRYNQKGQPTADAKIAFQTPDAAMKAFKMMNKKSLCGRPVFLKPV